MEKLPQVAKDDIESTKKLLGAVHTLSVFVARAVKEGWKSSYIFEIIGMASDIAAVAEEAKQLLPELKDLDKQEAEELAGIVYETVRTIVDMFVDKDEEEAQEEKKEEKKKEREGRRKERGREGKEL